MRVDRNSRMDMEAVHLRANEFARYWVAVKELDLSYLTGFSV